MRLRPPSRRVHWSLGFRHEGVRADSERAHQDSPAEGSGILTSGPLARVSFDSRAGEGLEVDQGGLERRRPLHRGTSAPASPSRRCLPWRFAASALDLPEMAELVAGVTTRLETGLRRKRTGRDAPRCWCRSSGRVARAASPAATPPYGCGSFRNRQLRGIATSDQGNVHLEGPLGSCRRVLEEIDANIPV